MQANCNFQSNKPLSMLTKMKRSVRDSERFQQRNKLLEKLWENHKQK